MASTVAATGTGTGTETETENETETESGTEVHGTEGMAIVRGTETGNMIAILLRVGDGVPVRVSLRGNRLLLLLPPPRQHRQSSILPLPRVPSPQSPLKLSRN